MTDAPMSVNGVREASPREWDEAWEACSYATYFQSRAWAEDWASYSNRSLRPYPLRLSFEDGATAVLPVTRQLRRKGLALRYWLSPAGTYGGCLAGEQLTRAHARGLLAWLQEDLTPFWWRVSPYDPHAEVFAPFATEQDETHAIQLGWGYDSACELATHGHRCAVRKAAREGLSVRRGGSPEDWAAYYRIYERSLERWGDRTSSRYDASLFELLRRRGSPSVELWLAQLADGDIVAGGVCLYGPRHVAYWHAAALSEFFSLRPANLLINEILLDACRREFSWLDLNPSSGHEGVREFKERVGASPLPCPVITCHGGRLPKPDDIVRFVRGAFGADA